MSHEVLQALTQRLGSAVVSTHDHRGDETAVIDEVALRETCLWLRDTPQWRFDMLTDLTAVDWLEQGHTPRFELVYQLYSMPRRHRLRLKVGLDHPDQGVDTISDIWRNANWLEREVWDMYGITFHGHPDPRRILLYESFEGHPLRKDYPKQKRQPLTRRPQHEIDEVMAGYPRSTGKRNLL